MSLRKIEGLIYDYLGNSGWGNALLRPCALCGTTTKMGATNWKRPVPVCGSCWEDRPEAEIRFVALERPLSRSNRPEKPEERSPSAVYQAWWDGADRVREALLSRSNGPRTDEPAPIQAEVPAEGDRGS